jgi:hypothetical protein
MNPKSIQSPPKASPTGYEEWSGNAPEKFGSAFPPKIG